MVFLYFCHLFLFLLCFYVFLFVILGGGRGKGGAGNVGPEHRGREGGSNAGHERIYMTPQIFDIFLSKLI